MKKKREYKFEYQDKPHSSYTSLFNLIQESETKPAIANLKRSIFFSVLRNQTEREKVLTQIKVFCWVQKGKVDLQLRSD